MSDPTNLDNLFASARDEGSISDESFRLLNLPDLGAKIQQGLGVHVDDIPASEVLLVTLLIDDSGSIHGAKNEPLVMEGHNTIVEALGESKQRSGVVIHTRYLNGTVLYPYAPLDQAVTMSARNYSATGGTPLYDEAVATLGTVVAKTQEFFDAGVPARTITVIVTDGEDMHSTRFRAGDVARLVGDMLHSETHIVAAVGVQNGRTDFRKVFRHMGIDDRWILTPGNTKGEIRQAFRLVSQTAVRTSQGRGAFSKTAVGGFGG
jgi:hypothetical protein